MFNTDLTIEEEGLLSQLLDGEKIDRMDILLTIKGVAQNTNPDERAGLEVAASLFNKIQNSSDYEYNEYRDLLINQATITE